MAKFCFVFLFIQIYRTFITLLQLNGDIFFDIYSEKGKGFLALFSSDGLGDKSCRNRFELNSILSRDTLKTSP